MKVAYNWLKDFVNITLNPKELAEKLTLAGLEVVSLKESSGDSVLEIEITSNRPDWLSIAGIAREVGAITGVKFDMGRFNRLKAKAGSKRRIEISVANEKDCPFYSATVIQGVKVAPSPDWLRKRLESLGCRSINNIVDITNYILFESGQPLHAFDLDALKRPFVAVRRARPEEKIITLDGRQVVLNQEILVIADQDRPVAVAGIMGGKETEVTLDTRNILLESAVFDPVLVRKGRQKTGLQSESAYRFERGVDLKGAKTASLAAQELIRKLAGGKVFSYGSAGASEPSSTTIKVKMSQINSLLGVSVPVLKAKQILSRLGFFVKVKPKETLLVKVPSFRQDVKSYVDVIEEVARIYGYNKIPMSLPAVKPSQSQDGARSSISEVKRVLSALGLNEVITYSLVDRNLLAKSGIGQELAPLEVLNPLSKEQEVLRYSLLPSLIKTVAHNLDQKQECVSIFEVADIFLPSRECPREEASLGIALCGTRSLFLERGLVKDEVGILHIKGILETVFRRLGVGGYSFKPTGNGRVSVVAGRDEAGYMLDLNEQVLAAFGIKNKKIVCAEIRINKLVSAGIPEKKFSGIPRYPAIGRDISFLVKDDISVEDILAEIRTRASSLLSSSRIIDYYQGKQIPSGFRALTISCEYRDKDRTLTEEEVSPLHDALCAGLENKFGIRLRQA
ncbi:MAG: phenylalanine--tRNA ligase subunit beta [Candidatus Omnitrophota bacterium]